MTSWGPGDLKEHRDHFVWKNTRNCVCYMVLSHNLSKKKSRGRNLLKDFNKLKHYTDFPRHLPVVLPIITLEQKGQNMRF